MGTKRKPGKFDCYKNAEPDEPMFVLLGRDASAPYLVRSWAGMRTALIKRGDKPESDQKMCDEALECAFAMEKYRVERNAKKRRVK